MADRVPSFFLLVPGPWGSAVELQRHLKRSGISATLRDEGVRAGEINLRVVEDSELALGFRASRQSALPAEVKARLAECSRAAVLECGFRLDEDSSRVAALGRALRELGGVAVRVEASGAASAWDPWLEALESGSAHDLYASAVLLVQDDDGLLFTCGMHVFDLPDAQVAMSTQRDAIEWLDAFCVYQLDESPQLASGHTFRPHTEVERRSFDRWPDHRHAPSDGRHNPFGVWRFHAPREPGVTAPDLIPVFIPSLSAVLLAAERSNASPLTRAQVEAIVANGTVMTMDIAAARELERSRGYADIEPELAWEQWQIVRVRS